MLLGCDADAAPFRLLLPLLSLLLLQGQEKMSERDPSSAFKWRTKSTDMLPSGAAAAAAAVTLCSCVTIVSQGQEKMSKSDPNSAIFMEDTNY
jgi:hypothetical protein